MAIKIVMERSQAKTVVTGGATRPLRVEPGLARTQQAMALESQRALSLFRAVNLTGDAGAARALLALAGRDGAQAVVSEVECAALAGGLRTRGYPLTDGGIKRFKMERGFSEVVRIGPDVASAYARFLTGNEAQLDVTAAEYRRLDVETQRALSLLALIGESAQELSAVARALGVKLASKPGASRPTITKQLAVRLVGFCKDLKLRFTDEGLSGAAAALGWPKASIDKQLATFVSSAVLLRGEPLHDYSHLTCQGAVLNGRTLAMLGVAERELDGAIGVRVIKGSYLEGTQKGAHPHMGGGVADLSVRNAEPKLVERYVLALRQAGFAAWFRAREDKPHIHAVAIGDRDLAPSAQWQVRQYFLGRDGRSRMDKDPHGGVPRQLPTWVEKYRLAALG